MTEINMMLTVSRNDTNSSSSSTGSSIQYSSTVSSNSNCIYKDHCTEVVIVSQIERRNSSSNNYRNCGSNCNNRDSTGNSMRSSTTSANSRNNK